MQVDDFIAHPRDFPLRCRQVWRGGDELRHEQGDKGLSFYSRRRFRAGARIRVRIPLRSAAHTLDGRVVLVRQLEQGYEIGIWFNNQDDADRARLIERICASELRLQRPTGGNGSMG